MMMESTANGDPYTRSSSSPTGVNINPSTFSGGGSSINNNLLPGNAPHHLRRFALPSASTIIRAPLSALLEYSGLLRSSRSPTPQDASTTQVSGSQHHHDDSFSNNGEVSIRIVSSNDSERQNGEPSNDLHTSDSSLSSPEADAGILPSSTSINEASDAAISNGRDSYQRYDIQQAAKWLEQILPFSLLLLVVFIRHHLQGVLVSIWVAIVMVKSNEILKKQTSLKGERKVSVLLAFSIAFVLHVIGVYWFYQDPNRLYPLIMLPPKSIPPFWNAIFIILVNDALVRQASMALKCLILILYKNSRGQTYRKQGQMLTLVEYLMLLYRALLPTPIWYRFFLDKSYGSLFSSLMTGLYLTFKLTYVVEKVQSFITAVKCLSRKEVHFGAYATAEQVVAAGDLCAICQEKMHAPVVLRCKHVFCEDCVSEWFERERTCPLCRALVKSADLKSFADGSTTLVFQIF